MKRITFFIITLMIVSVSCKKTSVISSNNGNVDSTVLLFSSGTLSQMIVIDESPTKRRFLELEEGGGPVYRHLIDKTYSFTYIGATFYSKWRIEGANYVKFPSNNMPTTLDNEVVMIHSKNKSDYWLYVVKGGTVNGKEEWYLWSNYVSANRPSTDQFKFRLHEVGVQNGIHTFTIESVLKPGYYLSNAGHTITANGVVLANSNVAGLQKTVFEFR